MSTYFLRKFQCAFSNADFTKKANFKLSSQPNRTVRTNVFYLVATTHCFQLLPLATSSGFSWTAKLQKVTPQQQVTTPAFKKRELHP
jgi:hypothetical protein